MHMPHLGIRIRAVLAGLAVAAAGLWALAAELHGHVDDQSMILTVGGAITCTLAGVFTVVALAVRDRDKDLLLRCLVEASERAARAQTVPLHLVRESR